MAKKALKKMSAESKAKEKIEVKAPNEITIQTFQHTDAGENLVRIQDKEALFEKLNI